MSERKVQNKYFPPEYDYRRTPKSRVRGGTSQWKIRNMLPFTVRCSTCGEFMFAGTKFNTPMERAGDYLGVSIFRFYYKCPQCSAEFTLCTDPENETYVVEQGATRPYGANDKVRTFREQAHEAAAAMEAEDAAAEGAAAGVSRSRASQADAMAAVESRAGEMRRQAEAEEEVEALLERRRAEASLGADAIIAMVQRGEVGGPAEGSTTPSAVGAAGAARASASAAGEGEAEDAAVLGWQDAVARADREFETAMAASGASRGRAASPARGRGEAGRDDEAGAATVAAASVGEGSAAAAAALGEVPILAGGIAATGGPREGVGATALLAGIAAKRRRKRAREAQEAADERPPAQRPAAGAVGAAAPSGAAAGLDPAEQAAPAGVADYGSSSSEDD